MKNNAKMMEGLRRVQGTGPLVDGMLDGGYEFGLAPGSVVGGVRDAKRLSLALSASSVMSKMRQQPTPARETNIDMNPKNTIDTANVMIVRARDVHKSR